MKRSSKIGIGSGIALLLLVLVLVGCHAATTTMASAGATLNSQSGRTFAVKGVPTLSIHNNAGAIVVKTGSDGKIIVKVVIHHQGTGRIPTFTLNQNRAKNTVSATGTVYPTNGNGQNSIDFIVTVPVHTNLDLVTFAGATSVTSVRGHMQVATNAGTVAMTNVVLKESGTISTKTGTIRFNGSIVSGSTYTLRSNVGAIYAVLASGSYRLRASTNIGDISSDFDSIQNDGSDASGTIGHGPYATLVIENQVGSIHIRKA